MFSKDPDLAKYFEISYGPYDNYANNKPFLPVSPKPLGAGYYPTDLKKQEFLEYIKSNTKDSESLQSPYTLVLRGSNGLFSVPFYKAYADDLKNAAHALFDAAASESRDKVRYYLESRAKALKNDDYYESDIQWIELPPEGLDIVIGPYEKYEDRLLGLKAAYEAIITISNPIETKKVGGFFEQLGDFHSHLTALLNLDFDPPGPSTPIVIADLLYSGGEARKGIPAIAFALPNDERVIQEKGTKMVILRNVLKMKYQHVLFPIWKLMNIETDDTQVFEAFLKHTILHEISHAIGPHQIKQAGHKTTVNKALRELHTTLEEAKADVLSAYCLLWKNKGLSDSISLNTFASYYFPELLRSIRFGYSQAHGRASLLIFNYFVDSGILKFSNHCRATMTQSSIEDGLRTLAGEILSIQCEGNYDAADQMIRKYCQPTKVINDLVKSLEDIPIDIVFNFSLGL
ncbi:hypothetical protein MYX76_07640 [Desulfobacterota bacterium AH_259_B03_O07]|nr:hypothetical protein [Desulfobacterota bacterium AH_259_B03_O07]